MVARLLLLSLLIVSLSGCIGDPVPDAMDYLADRLPEQNLSGRILILGAVVASGLDIQAWPSRDAAIGNDLQEPETYGDQLRMLHALATARAPEDAWTPLVDAVWDGHDGEQFGTPGVLTDDALAVAALMAAGVVPDDERIVAAVAMLQDTQAPDGGWAWNGADRGEPDETAWVVQALVAADALDDTTRGRAVAFLTDRMHDDGSYDHGGTVNCHSTGLALLAWHHVGDPAPRAIHSSLAACQNPDGGFPHIKGGPSQVWATAETVQGLAAS